VVAHDVVVLGAGYAGLLAAKRLACRVYADEVRVSLVSAGPDFVERPRLHQVATWQQVPRRPLSTWLAGTHVRRVPGAVDGLDLQRRRVSVRAADGHTDIAYQTLVYALGSNIDVHTVPGVSTHTAQHLSATIASLERKAWDKACAICRRFSALPSLSTRLWHMRVGPPPSVVARGTTS
jgi:NADH:ubiquinone reductase (H+-translocating)